MIVAGAASCRTGVAVYKLNESLNGTLIAGAASQEACDGPAGLKTLAPVSGTLAPGEYYVAMASTSAGATYAGIGANGASQTAHLGGTVAPLTVQSAGGVFNGNHLALLGFVHGCSVCHIHTCGGATQIVRILR
jgi:hypothetical protein